MLIILEAMCYGGKTTLGSMVAKDLQLDNKDFKDLFYETYGITENEYLTQKGTISFKNAERLILYDIVNGKYDNIVISLSGSSVYNDKEMEQISKIAKVIYLNVPFDVIQKRRELDPRKDIRPILYPSGIDNFYDLYHQRIEMYKKYATITIHVSSSDTPEDTRLDINRRILE